MNFSELSKSAILSLIVLPLSLSYANLDFLSDLYYDSSKTYSVDDNVVLESDPSEIYTAIAAVPVNTPPPNSQYWSSSEEHTTNLTEENSDDLSTTPSDNFDQTTPGTPPTDEEPSFSPSLLEIAIDENDGTEVTTVFASNAVSYALSQESDYELFDLDDTTFQLSFKESPDYEDPVDLDENNIYQVVVVASNSYGTASQTVQITVQNIIEQPAFTSSSTADFDSGASGTVYTATATDNATFSLSGTDYQLFTINSATGDLTFNSSPDYNNPTDTNSDNVYELVIQAENSAGSEFLSLSITVSVPSVITAPSRFLGISTRGPVTSDSYLHAGLIVNGLDNKTVVFMAKGQLLANYGVPGVLSDPLIEIYDVTGTLIYSNDSWTSAEGSQNLSNYSTFAGITLPVDSSEAGLAVSLAPGAYTAVVKGVNGASGIALVEAYELSGETPQTSFLGISTRGPVTSDSFMHAGIGIEGDSPKKVAFMAKGPLLSNYGVPGALVDPVLEIYDITGTMIYTNDSWDTAGGTQNISAYAGKAGITQPVSTDEGAIVVELNPGAYTALIKGANGSEGIGLIEAYEISD